jgi:hypothetical protein
VKDLCPEKTDGIIARDHGEGFHHRDTEVTKLREGGEIWASDLGNPL